MVTTTESRMERRKQSIQKKPIVSRAAAWSRRRATVFFAIVMTSIAMNSQTKWSISSAYNKEFSTIASNFTVDLSKRFYASNYMFYATKGVNATQPSFLMSTTMLNYKATDRLILSSGYLSAKNITQGFNNNLLTFKVTLKLIK